MIVLYNAPRSSASRRVRLCLEEKGLLYESRTVDMERLEHHSAEYLKVNLLLCVATAGYLLYRRFSLGRTIYDPWP